MLKFIISLFILILFIAGCENKTNFDEVIKKLQQQNKITKEKTDKNITTSHNQEIKKIHKVKKHENNESKIILVNKEEIKPKKKITQLTLKTASGLKLNLKFLKEGISFQEYKNKIIILDIFTTWCPPCIKSIPHLIQIQKKYKNNLQIIGILMEEDKRDSQLLQFKQEHHINYPISNCKNNFVLTDTWGGISGYPTIIIFDKNGTYFNHYNGSPPIEMLESDIKKVLSK